VKEDEMGDKDREEVAQWIQHIESLFQYFAQIISKLTNALQKGPAEYMEVWAEGELPAILQEVKEMPVPKESNCKSAKKSFEKGIDAQIKAWAIQAKCTEETALDRLWKAQISGMLAASQSMLKNMLSDLDSLRKKYQI
jgi:hypothetical protein